MYDTGFQAYERENFDYAVEMFKRIVALEPEYVKARKALRATERKLHAGSKGGLGASLKAVGLQIKTLLPVVKKRYRRVMEMCEEFLVNDPYNKTALMLLGTAALKGEFPETAVMAFEDLASNNSGDKKALRFLARAYAGKHDYENAIKGWQRLLKKYPGDREAKVEVKALAARQSLEETWDGEKGARNFSSKIRSSEDARRAKAKDRRIRTADELDEAIEFALEDHEKDPKSLRLIMKVGDLLRQKGQDAEAKRYYKRALDVDSNYNHARIRLADMDIAAYAKAEEDARAEYGADPKNPSLKKALAEARKTRLIYEIREYERRAKEQPTDLSLRYHLGCLYYDGGLLEKAIGAFQRARKDPKLRTQVLLFLGKCFIKRKEFSAAVEPLTEVVDSIAVMNATKKDALYDRGEVYLAMGKKEEARGDWMAIYLEDIKFKDIASRIKGLEADVSNN